MMLKREFPNLMQETESQPIMFQFGSFELATGTGELRKRGIRLKLQDQPFQILSLLLQRPGEVVSRDEIQHRLWPLGTHVDFDNAINGAIRKLRDTLGDDADNPRFIETISRRGYRFIAPVLSVNLPPAESDVPSPVGAAPAIVPAPIIPSPPKKRLMLWAVAGSVVVLAAVLLTLPFRKVSGPISDSGTSAVPLTGNGGYEAFSTFSPEGTRIAFSWDRFGREKPGIFVKLIGSGEPVRLTRSQTGDFGPAWSPNGAYIAFLRARYPLHAALVTIPALGGPEREVTTVCFSGEDVLHHVKSLPQPPAFVAWSADGKWLITLDRGSPDLPAAIVAVSVETGERRTLTTPPPGGNGDGSIAISPDGRLLAFTRTLTTFARDIYVLPVSSDMHAAGNPRRLTFDNAEIDGLAWTADGRRLVFSSKREGRRELWQMLAAPSATPIRINAAGDEPHDVSVARQGGRLLYAHQILDWDIWRFGLSKSKHQALSRFISSTRLDFHPVYSPDGKHIAFESNRSGNASIWIANADGLNAVRLTDDPKASTGSPAWSPDSQQIAFQGDASGRWDIYVMGAHGGASSRITSTGDGLRPSWSRDGKSIYFCSARTGSTQVWKVPATGGQETQVTKGGGCIAQESADGKYLYYTKEPNSLWKVPVRGGQETVVLNPIFGASFVPTKHGIYFMTLAGDPGGALNMKLLDEQTNSIRTLGSIPGRVGYQMSISPDEQWVLFHKPEREGSELMLIENFR